MTYCFLCLLYEDSDMVFVMLYHGDNISERSFAEHVRMYAVGEVALDILDTRYLRIALAFRLLNGFNLQL